MSQAVAGIAPADTRWALTDPRIFWIPGDTFRMGSDRHYPKAAPGPAMGCPCVSPLSTSGIAEQRSDADATGPGAPPRRNTPGTVPAWRSDGCIRTPGERLPDSPFAPLRVERALVVHAAVPSRQASADGST